VDLVRSGLFRGIAHDCDWPNAASGFSSFAHYPDGLDFVCLFSVLFYKGENPELVCCNKESTVVDAMWGAGSEESAERLEMACESRITTSTRTITP
jgi:hypothetical protein